MSILNRALIVAY